MFEVHHKLVEDCYSIGNFDLSQLLLMNDANYPWFILLPKVRNTTEIFQLSNADQQQLMVESSALSKAMVSQFNAEKMNIAALGNVVPQLHIHHIARYTNDAAWPDPIWGKVSAVPYLSEEMDIICSRLVSALTIPFTLEC